MTNKKAYVSPEVYSHSPLEAVADTIYYYYYV